MYNNTKPNSKAPSIPVSFNYYSPKNHILQLLNNKCGFKGNCPDRIGDGGRGNVSLFTGGKVCQEELDTTVQSERERVGKYGGSRKGISQSVIFGQQNNVGLSPRVYNHGAASSIEKISGGEGELRQLKKSCMPVMAKFQEVGQQKMPQNDQKQNQKMSSINRIVSPPMPTSKHFSFSKNISKKNIKPQKNGSKLSSARVEDFQFGQLLGKGSLGKVYLARHLKTGCYYAIKKVVKCEILDRDQFCLSVKSQIFFNDPHIAQIYACFSDELSIYLVMELCLDGNLINYRKVMRHDSERGRAVLGVAKGLKKMHQENMRHGDLKLQNVLVSYGMTKLTDFDCIFKQKQQDSCVKRQKYKLWGSPAYFSPQMVTDSTFSLADDIWSLGVILYEVYCKAHPFDLVSCSSLKKIVEKPICPPPKQVPDFIKTLIQKTLQKNAGDRLALSQIISECEATQHN